MLFKYLINDYFANTEDDTNCNEIHKELNNDSINNIFKHKNLDDQLPRYNIGRLPSGLFASNNSFVNSNLFVINYIKNNINPNLNNLKMMGTGQLFYKYLKEKQTDSQCKKPEPGLHLIVGPMKVGKTKYLVETCEYNKDSSKILFVNNYLERERLKVDISNKLNEVRTVKCHDKDRELSDDIDIIYTSSITEIKSLLDNYDLIVINEAQFFQDIEILRNYFFIDKRFIIAGLDSDKYGRDFGYVKELLKFSNRIDKFTGVCEDCNNRKAIFSKLKTNDIGSVVDIGGSNKYKIVCGKCFYS